MSYPDYTLVLGVDLKHFEQLTHTWPTWRKHKPSVVNRDTIIFYDRDQIPKGAVARWFANHPYQVTEIPWPPEEVTYPQGTNKWNNQQRYKMLSGFVHVPPRFINTPYWLKLDTDVVATGNDDWVNPEWFKNNPAIVSHPWGFTKPPNQMQLLDAWVNFLPGHYPIHKTKPLNLVPVLGSDKLRHSRIISWCSFYSAQFSVEASNLANLDCGQGKLPVPSQDGYMWYLATRLGWEIVRPNMKELGWQHWSTMRNIIKHSQEAMNA